MTEQERILRACTHIQPDEKGQMCEVELRDGTILHVCDVCWNASVYARRSVRKAELDAMPRCEVPGCRMRATFTIGSAPATVGMCGRHVRRAQNAWQREVARACGGLWLPIAVHFSRDELIELAQRVS